MDMRQGVAFSSERIFCNTVFVFLGALLQIATVDETAIGTSADIAKLEHLLAIIIPRLN